MGKKRFSNFLLAMSVVFGSVPAMAVQAYSVPDSGYDLNSSSNFWEGDYSKYSSMAEYMSVPFSAENLKWCGRQSIVVMERNYKVEAEPNAGFIVRPNSVDSGAPSIIVQVNMEDVLFEGIQWNTQYVNVSPLGNNVYKLMFKQNAKFNAVSPLCYMKCAKTTVTDYDGSPISSAISKHLELNVIRFGDIFASQWTDYMKVSSYPRVQIATATLNRDKCEGLLTDDKLQFGNNYALKFDQKWLDSHPDVKVKYNNGLQPIVGDTCSFERVPNCTYYEITWTESQTTGALCTYVHTMNIDTNRPVITASNEHSFVLYKEAVDKTKTNSYYIEGDKLVVNIEDEDPDLDIRVEGIDQGLYQINKTQKTIEFPLQFEGSAHIADLTKLKGVIVVTDNSNNSTQVSMTQLFPELEDTKVSVYETTFLTQNPMILRFGKSCYKTGDNLSFTISSENPKYSLGDISKIEIWTNDMKTKLWTSTKSFKVNRDNQIEVNGIDLSKELNLKEGTTNTVSVGIRTYFSDNERDSMLFSKTLIFDSEAPKLTNYRLAPTDSLANIRVIEINGKNYLSTNQPLCLSVETENDIGAPFSSFTLITEVGSKTNINANSIGNTKFTTVVPTYDTVENINGAKTYIQLEDNLGNKSKYELGKDILYDGQEFEGIILDNSGPVVTIQLSGDVIHSATEDREFLGENVNILISCMDADLDTLTIEKDGIPVQLDASGSTATIKVQNETNVTIRAVATDKIGNITEEKRTYYRDKTPPPTPQGEMKILGKNLREERIGSTTVYQDGFRLILNEIKDNNGESGIDSYYLYSIDSEGNRTEKEQDEGFSQNKEICYSFDYKPTRLEMVVVDRAQNTATYDLTDMTGVSLDNIAVDKEQARISVQEPADKKAGNWYAGTAHAFSITAEDDTTITGLQIYINGREYMECQNLSTLQKRVEYTLSTNDLEKFQPNKDGETKYDITVKALDAVGNNSDTVEYTVNIDDTNPEIVSFDIFGNVQEAKDLNKKGEHDRYGYFLKGNGKVVIKAKDENTSSGIKGILYTLYDKDDKVYKEDFAEYNNGCAVVDLPKNFKGFIEATAVDNVGLESLEPVGPDGFVNSNATLNSTIIDINLPETEYKDINGLSLYPKDVHGEIVVHENESGWKNVKWGTIVNGEKRVYQSVEVDKDGKLHGDADVKKKDKNLVIDMDGMISVADDVNAIKVWVEVEDNLGETSSRDAVFSIDKEIPQIKVDYNDTIQNNIYNKERTATVTISERNFDKKSVDIGGNNTGVSAWTDGPNNTHQCVVRFGKDNDYQLTVDFVDMAGNRAESYISEKFTIDTTAPEMQVSFDNNTSQNGNYFANARTATIKITEHHFDEKKINIITEGMVGQWHTTGDMHVMTVLFGRDGEYSLSVDGVDRAGNQVAPYQSDRFIVDMTAPTISINGVENGVSHKGDVSVRVSLGDNYLDGERTSVILESRKHGKLDMQTNFSGTVASYVLDSIPKEKEWDDAYILSIIVTDKAGNRSAKDLSFTVNRFGSQYNVDQDDIIGKTTAILPPEFTIKETSVDRIDMDKTTVEILRGGDIYKYDSSLVTKVEDKKDEGYEYTYTLKNSAFVDDGKYTVGVVSIADDGTRNGSSRNNFSFIYDTSVPKISISGIDEGMSYITDKQDVTVDFDDLSGITDSSITVNGERIDPEANNLYQKFSLPQAKDSYTVVVEAKDLAGNQSRSELKGVRVSNTWYDKVKAVLERYLIIVMPLVALLIFVAIFAYYGIRRKKMNEEIRRQNMD